MGNLRTFDRPHISEWSTMITDIGGTKINGKEENLVLDADSIPVRGVVVDG